MKNAWLISNGVTLEKVKRLLIQLEYLPIFQDYPVRTIHSLFNGLEAEVNRLQKEIDNVKVENEKLKKEAEKQEVKIDGKIKTR
jgi:hypothetical protein